MSKTSSRATQTRETETKEYTYTEPNWLDIPDSVVERARVVLGTLESGDRAGSEKKQSLMDDLPLFSATPAPKTAQGPSQLEQAIKDIHPDDLSPKEALKTLYELKELLER